MATTTNYGWTTPDDTALVKDGAAAIRTLGSSIDTSVKSLNAGTTAGDLDYYTSATAKTRVAIGTSGQSLTVVGGVPAWAASPTSVLTAKGDVLTATGANTIARLGVGANDTVLIADSTTATGLKWGTPAAGSMTQLATGNLAGLSTVNITSISQSYRNLILVIKSAQQAAGNRVQIRLNNVSTALYNRTSFQSDGTTLVNDANASQWTIPDSGGASANSATQIITINNYTNAAHPTTVSTQDGNAAGRGSWGVLGMSQSGVDGAITQVNLLLSSGTWTAGNYTLFGVN